MSMMRVEIGLDNTGFVNGMEAAARVLDERTKYMSATSRRFSERMQSQLNKMTMSESEYAAYRATMSGVNKLDLAKIRNTALAIEGERKRAAAVKQTELAEAAAARQRERTINQLRLLGSVMFAGLGTRELAASADRWTTLSNRVRLVTDTTEEFISAQKGVVNIAARTGQALDSTAQVYQSVARNQKELGVTSEEVIRLTNTISKSMVIGGGSAEGNAAALVQLSQAFSSGVLRGDEFRSVMEQAPGLTQALADGLKVPVGALRELAFAGKLTSGVFVKALQDMEGAVDDRFKNVNLTVGQSFVALIARFDEFIGGSDEATGASVALSKIILTVADNLDVLAYAAMAFVAIRMAATIRASTLALIEYVATQRLSVVASTQQITVSSLLATSYTRVAAAARAAMASQVALIATPIGAALLAATAGFIALKSAMNAATGKDASNDISDFFDTILIKLGLIEESSGSLGGAMADFVSDIKNAKMEAGDFAVILGKMGFMPGGFQAGLRDMAKIGSKLEGGSAYAQAPEYVSKELQKFNDELSKSASEMEHTNKYWSFTREELENLNRTTQLREHAERIAAGAANDAEKAAYAEAEATFVRIQAAQDHSKAIEANKKALEESERVTKANAEAVKSTLDGLVNQAAMLGKSQEDILGMQLAAKGASKEQISLAKSAQGVITAYEKQVAVMDRLKELDTQVAQLGMTDMQKKLDDLARQGATPEQLEYARKQLAAIDSFESSQQKFAASVDKMSSSADKMLESTRTDKFGNKLGEAKDRFEEMYFKNISTSNGAASFYSGAQDDRAIAPQSVKTYTLDLGLGRAEEDRLKLDILGSEEMDNAIGNFIARKARQLN